MLVHVMPADRAESRAVLRSSSTYALYYYYPPSRPVSIVSPRTPKELQLMSSSPSTCLPFHVHLLQHEFHHPPPSVEMIARIELMKTFFRLNLRLAWHRCPLIRLFSRWSRRPAALARCCAISGSMVSNGCRPSSSGRKCRHLACSRW